MVGAHENLSNLTYRERRASSPRICVVLRMADATGLTNLEHGNHRSHRGLAKGIILKRLLQLSLLTFVCSMFFAAPAFAQSGIQSGTQSSTSPEFGVLKGFEKTQSTTGYGFQIYDCVNGAWEFRNPSATLFDNNTGGLSGGSTWQSPVVLIGR